MQQIVGKEKNPLQYDDPPIFLSLSFSLVHFFFSSYLPAFIKLLFSFYFLYFAFPSMLKIRSLFTLLLLGCMGLLTYTAYQHREDFRDRSLSSLTNEKPQTDGLFQMFNGGIGDLFQGDNHVVMGKMANETLRAQLGRRTWYLMHVMASRYPPEPTKDEKQAMKSFLFLLSRLYPCGDCAHHFQQHLKKHPPVVDTRDGLEQYLCSMHNVVNKSLKKPLFNCTEVHETYDCGCGPDNVRYKPGN